MRPCLRFRLPPDKDGFVVTGYIHLSTVNILAQTIETTIPPPAEVKENTVPAADEVEMLEDDENNYEVVAAPIGATVPYLPDDADEQTIQGKKYFVYDGSYYRPFASDGETIYMVVEDPQKAA